MVFFILLELKSRFPASHDFDRNSGVTIVRYKGLAAAVHKQEWKTKEKRNKKDNLQLALKKYPPAQQ